MQEHDMILETEKALQRLIPVGLSEGVQEELDAQFDELAGGQLIHFRAAVRWVAGIGMAAAIAMGLFVGFSKVGVSGNELAGLDGTKMDAVFLEEGDRLEQVSDDGLYVDAGGSAVRKLRMRMVEESRIRDGETGIIVDVSVPRDETYLLPINTF